MTRNPHTTTSGRAPLLTNPRQPVASPPARIEPSPGGRSKGSAPTPDEVRLRAFEIYQARGATPGREREDWEQAVRELQQARRASKKQ